MSGPREAFGEIVADVPVYGDLDRPIEQAERERRRRYGKVAGLAAAAAVVVMSVGVLAVTRDSDGSPEPIGPTTPSSTGATTTAPATPTVNGRLTSAERYLGGNGGGYGWRDFDPDTETGLYVSDGTTCCPLESFTVVGRSGPIATLTCSGALACSPEGTLVETVATLGPGANEVTVLSSDHHTARVFGYDGSLHRTLDLSATISGGGEVFGLRWSPDGSRLAILTVDYAREAPLPTVQRVWLLDGSGDAQLAYSPSRGNLIWEPGWGWSWSPDGQSLMLDVKEPGSNGAKVIVLRLHPEGAAIAQTLYRSDRNFDWWGNLAWSPDGTRIGVRTHHHITEISAEDGSVIAQHPHNQGWLIWPKEDHR